MAATAQLRSAAQVLNWYNDQPQAAFKLYRFSVRSSNITGAYDGKSKDEGYEKLQSELALIAPDDFNSYVLGVFNEKDKEKATPAINKVFVVNEPPAGMPMVSGGYVSPGQYAMNNEILNEIRALRAERLAKEEDEEEEDEPEAPTPSSILAGMLMQPSVQNALIGILGNLAASFMKPAAPVAQVAGTHTHEEIMHTLDILFSKGVTPEDLKKLSEMPQGQISMLLGMLRK